jgi:hypothetical protein
VSRLHADPARPDGIRLLLAAALCCGVLRLGALRGRDVVTWTFLAWLVGAYLGAQTSSRGYGHYYAPLVAPAVALVVLPVPNLGRALAAVLPFAALGAVLLAVRSSQTSGAAADEIASRVYGRQEAGPLEARDEIGPFLRSQARAGEPPVRGRVETAVLLELRAPGREPVAVRLPGRDRARALLPKVAGLCRDGPRFVVVAIDPLPAYAGAARRERIPRGHAARAGLSARALSCPLRPCAWASWPG